MDEDKVPTPQSEPTCDPRTVRERTLAHMESLMMQLTTVGAGIALACGAQFQPQPRRPQRDSRLAPRAREHGPVCRLGGFGWALVRPIGA